MINPSKIINKEIEYNKTLTLVSAKKRLKYLKFTRDTKEMENLYALLASIINKNAFNDNELMELVMDIRNLKSFKLFIDKEINKILDNEKCNVLIYYIENYSYNNLYPYFLSNFRINKSRELSFLPLDLRLCVYSKLLKFEQCGLTSMHYLDRISVTLSKMGLNDLASIICGYNWILNWGEIRGMNTNEYLKDEVIAIGKLKPLRTNILEKRGIGIDKYLDEFEHCIAQFSNIEIINDREIAKKLLPLLEKYYANISNIQKYINDIEAYLSTGDDKNITQIRALIKSFECEYTDYISQNLKNNSKKYGTQQETISQSYKESFEVIRVRAEFGDMEYEFKLASSYHKGDSIEKNNVEAVKWYMRSANQGYRLAQYNLALCFLTGEGVDQNFKEGIKWLKKAASQGDEFAQYNLGVAYERGEFNITQSFEECVKWYTKSAIRGNKYAQYNLGNCYAEGKGVKLDYKNAIKWFEKAAKQGHRDAQKNLAILNEKCGNIADAIKWYINAAEQGDIDAQFNLGVHFLKGNTIERDIERGVYWLKQAELNGDKQAKLILSKYILL